MPTRTNTDRTIFPQGTGRKWHTFDKNTPTRPVSGSHYVYVARLPNGKYSDWYVGETARSPHERFREHEKSSYSKDFGKRFQATGGCENWHILVCMVRSADMAKRLEATLIQQLDTLGVGHGLNRSAGGTGSDRFLGKTKEERSAAVKRGNDSRTPEQRSQATAKGHVKRGAKGRRAAGIKSRDTRQIRKIFKDFGTFVESVDGMTEPPPPREPPAYLNFDEENPTLLAQTMERIHEYREHMRNFKK